MVPRIAQLEYRGGDCCHACGEAQPHFCNLSNANCICELEKVISKRSSQCNGLGQASAFCIQELKCLVHSKGTFELTVHLSLSGRLLGCLLAQLAVVQGSGLEAAVDSSKCCEADKEAHTLAHRLTGMYDTLGGGQADHLLG